MKQLIFNFHGVGEPPPGTGADELKYWWKAEPFAAALDRISEARRHAGSDIVITFDDGNMSDATLAMPALVKRGLTAEFFVCAGRLGKAGYLDRGALAELIDAGMGVGSHGMNHVDWRRTDDRELNAEIPDAIAKLEQVSGRSVGSVAIPFGSYDRRVMARLRRARLNAVYTSDGGYAGTDDWLRPRNTLDRSWQDGDFVSACGRSGGPWKTWRRKVSIAYKQWR
jgi:peptidoglycan/xylan/chitin deacetylase (PgdA/CDA1 family)